MTDKQCAFVDEETGNHCPRVIKAGLFCPVHDPANEKTVCYIREEKGSLKESPDEGGGMDCAAFKTKRKRKSSETRV
jgi:hypothetical protein